MSDTEGEELSDLLYNFSHHLLPSEEFIKYGNEACDKIFSVLKQQSKFDVARTYICGSMGKKTSILNSDYDLVIFVNDEMPPFTKVVEDFEKLLKTIPGLEIKRINQFSLKVKYQGYPIDILPAPNFIKPRRRKKIPRFRSLAAHQALKTYKKIEESQSKNQSNKRKRSNKAPPQLCSFSSSLCETQLRFMRRQSSFIHSLVRLCKFWNMTIFNCGYISGRSTMVELLAVYAGQEEEEEKEEENESPSMLDAFQKFLDLMQNFDTLDIDFEYNPVKAIYRGLIWKKAWKPNVPGCYDSYDNNNNNYDDSLPCIREPANPYNNIASDVDDDQMEIFQQHAQVTLAKLDHVLAQYSDYEDYALDYIFSPSSTFTPFDAPHLANIKKLMYNSRFQVWVSSFTGDKAGNYQGPRCSSLKYTKEFNYQEMQEALKGMETLFNIVAKTYVSDYVSYTGDNFDREDCRSDLWNRMEECIDENIWGVVHKEWKSQDKYYDSDVTFIIPITVKRKRTKFCIWITFDIKKKQKRRPRRRRR